jgi:hypothetical protein
MSIRRSTVVNSFGDRDGSTTDSGCRSKMSTALLRTPSALPADSRSSRTR